MPIDKSKVMGKSKLGGGKPHKAPPIIRWVGAYTQGKFSLQDQFRYEFLQPYGKSAEALKHQHAYKPKAWFSHLAVKTGLGLVVDISATPLHRCYRGDVHTTRGYETWNKIPLLYRKPHEEPDKKYVTKYSQIWGLVSSHNDEMDDNSFIYSYDEAVVGNGKNPVRYQAIVYRSDRKTEAKFFAEVTGLPLHEVVGDDGSIYLDTLGYETKDYFPR